MARTDYGNFLKRLYGCRVQKLNVNAGFTCPNRDGTLATGGCTYCNNSSFTPKFGRASATVTQQLLDGKQFYKGKYQSVKYLAYFQSYTGTYAPESKLKLLYEEALSVPDVLGLVISTRPDCLSDEVLDLLAVINQRSKVIVEIGIESSHDKTLQLINRCHTWRCAVSAVERIVSREIAVGAHLILGLPGESQADMLATARAVAQLPLSTVKFHQLQVLRGTKLAQQWQRGEVALQEWTAQEYAIFCRQVVDCLPPSMVVERMVATAPAQMLLHPRWGLKPQQFDDLFHDL